MKEKNNITTLQLLHAGLLADFVLVLDKNDLLEKITAQKEIENSLAAPARVRQLGFKNPIDVFNFYSEIIGFTEWGFISVAGSYSFTAKQCKLKNVAASLLSESPCILCCFNPIASLCRSLEIPYKAKVVQTLWESGSCIFQVLPEIEPINK
jgi:hypothetical protein